LPAREVQGRVPRTAAGGGAEEDRGRGGAGGRAGEAARAGDRPDGGAEGEPLAARGGPGAARRGRAGGGRKATARRTRPRRRATGPQASRAQEVEVRPRRAGGPARADFD